MLPNKKLPSGVKVCGIWYKIQVTKKPCKIEGDDDLYGGVISYNDTKIRIWGGRNLQQMRKTLWHELYHAFRWETRAKPEEDEEYLASSFATMMMGLEYKY